MATRGNASKRGTAAMGVRKRKMLASKGGRSSSTRGEELSPRRGRATKTLGKAIKVLGIKRAVKKVRSRKAA